LVLLQTESLERRAARPRAARSHEGVRTPQGATVLVRVVMFW